MKFFSCASPPSYLPSMFGVDQPFPTFVKVHGHQVYLKTMVNQCQHRFLLIPNPGRGLHCRSHPTNAASYSGLLRTLLPQPPGRHMLLLPPRACLPLALSWKSFFPISNTSVNESSTLLSRIRSSKTFRRSVTLSIFQLNWKPVYFALSCGPVRHPSFFLDMLQVAY